MQKAEPLSEKRLPQLHDEAHFFDSLIHRLRLIWRLLMDRRVSPFLKVLPAAAAIYFAAPDLLPGPFDDVVMTWLALRLFVELSPPEVVQEHMDAMLRVIPGRWKISGHEAPGEEESSHGPPDPLEGQFYDAP